MPILLVVALLLLPIASQEAVYQLMDAQGNTRCIEYDGVSRYEPPPGSKLVAMPDCTVAPKAPRQFWLRRWLGFGGN